MRVLLSWFVITMALITGSWSWKRLPNENKGVKLVALGPVNTMGPMAAWWFGFNFDLNAHFWMLSMLSRALPRTKVAQFKMASQSSKKQSTSHFVHNKQFPSGSIVVFCHLAGCRRWLQSAMVTSTIIRSWSSFFWHSTAQKITCCFKLAQARVPGSTQSYDENQALIWAEMELIWRWRFVVWLHERPRIECEPQSACCWCPWPIIAQNKQWLWWNVAPQGWQNEPYGGNKIWKLCKHARFLFAALAMATSNGWPRAKEKIGI